MHGHTRTLRVLIFLEIPVPPKAKGREKLESISVAAIELPYIPSMESPGFGAES
jgi:hypothetical protein